MKELSKENCADDLGSFFLANQKRTIHNKILLQLQWINSFYMVNEHLHI